MATNSREYNAKYRAANRERIREHNRKWEAANRELKNARQRERSKNPETLAKRRASAAAWRERNRESERIRHRTRYANNREERCSYALEWKRNKQEKLAGRPRSAKCESCGEDAQTVFDHCHNSGNFRGWLCCKCNAALGMLDDDPQKIIKLAAYMEKHVSILGMKIGNKS